MLCKGKPMKLEYLSIGASFRNVEGLLYRRLRKTAKVGLWKRIASPCRNSDEERRGRAPCLGNLKDM